MTPSSPKRPSHRLAPKQLQLIAFGWVILSLIAGVCVFTVVYLALPGGDGSDSAAVQESETSVAHAAQLTPDPAAASGEEAAGASTPPSPTPTPTQAKEPPPVSDFILGGQVVHGGIPHADFMHRAGMSWVKVQAFDINYDFSESINNVHNNGFRILISFRDDANKDRVTSPNYQQTMLAYLTTLAVQGADAIEVWNEPNIDREWPAGQISGESYTQLLRQAYPAIKEANPDTMVISGALAPTGFFGGACTVNGCDDKPYLEQMVAAGALDYMDCIGVHYNEGILPPSASSGDPRGNSEHYTRYYPKMVDTYLGVTSGSKPLCFTELGYLAGAEYADLATTSPGFSWAANTTIEQQAAWLAEAVNLAIASDGQVRMIVVFNVDIETSGADPQSGYAIVRPDSSCPACDTLATAMSAIGR